MGRRAKVEIVLSTEAEARASARKIHELAGRKFERLNPQYPVLVVGREGVSWVCLCDCGSTHVVDQRALMRSDSRSTRSCGCLKKERTAIAGLGNKRGFKHGHSPALGAAPEYTSWKAMRRRCRNPRYKNYAYYGGRGITVCDRWFNSFEAFLADMGPRPSGTTLDRFPNNDGNYEPGNCRWATIDEQSANKRNNTFLEHDGDRMTVAQWAKRLGLDKQTLECRLKRGWSVTRTLTVPTPKSLARAKVAA